MVMCTSCLCRKWACQQITSTSWLECFRTSRFLRTWISLLRKCINTTSWPCQVTSCFLTITWLSSRRAKHLLSVCVWALLAADSANIKILNAGAWSRSSEKVFVSLPTELEDLIPEAEEFYKKNHSGRKLHWNHLMSNGIVSGALCWWGGGQ